MKPNTLLEWTTPNVDDDDNVQDYRARERHAKVRTLTTDGAGMGERKKTE